MQELSARTTAEQEALHDRSSGLEQVERAVSLEQRRSAAIALLVEVSVEQVWVSADQGLAKNVTILKLFSRMQHQLWVL